MKIRPLRDNILVKRVDAETKSPGGLLIPDAHQLKSRWGEVLAVGPGRHLKHTADRRPVDPLIRPGVVVRFKGTSGIEIDNDEGVPLVMLTEDEVEAIREES